MIPTPPTANVLNPLLWLGCHVNGNLASTGSGVIIIVDGAEYLATALHVIEEFGLNPRVRSNGSWLPIDWQTVAVDEQHDVAVLKTNTVLDPQKIPVKYGELGMVYGGVGYVLGYPTWDDIGGLQTKHITEAGGRAIPIASLVVANFTASGESTYSASYINAGFSGGAVVFPLANDDWTIAGWIVTHFPTVQRAVYRGGVETCDYVKEHTGLVGYTSLPLVLDLIARA